MNEGSALYKADDNSALRFFYEPSKNNFVSEREARPVYDSVLYVEVMTPGSKESAPVFELERTFCKEAGIKEPRQSQHYFKYAKQVNAFKAAVDGGALQGTPLSAWPQIDRALAATLHAAKIFTVEALADVPDSALPVLGMGGRTLRSQAAAWLAAAKDSAPSAALVAENEKLRAELADARQAQKALSDRLTALEAKQAAPAPLPPLTAPEQQQPVKSGKPSTGNASKDVI